MSNEFKLVPVDPTEEMQDVGCSAMPVDWASPFDAGKVYEAMLAAAPQPPEVGGLLNDVRVSRELLERITQTCMFTLACSDYEQLRALLAQPAGSEKA